jgi:hypothetical protein
MPHGKDLFEASASFSLAPGGSWKLSMHPTSNKNLDNFESKHSAMV